MEDDRLQREIAKRMKLSRISDKSFLCVETVLYANYLIYLRILSIFHVTTHYAESEVVRRANEQVRTKGLGVTSITGNPLPASEQRD